MSNSTSRHGAAAAVGSRTIYTPVNRVSLIVADELMILGGIFMPVTSGVKCAAFLFLSCACFLFIMYHSVRALVEIMVRTQTTTMAGGMGRLVDNTHLLSIA